MKAIMQGVCRGDGRVYVKIRVEGFTAKNELSVFASIGNARIPASLHALSEPGVYVVVLPLISGGKIQFTLQEIAEGVQVVSEITKRLSSRRAKWESRFNYRLHKDICLQIRDIESKSMASPAYLELRNYLDDLPDAVWRFHAAFLIGEETENVQPHVRVLDKNMQPLAATVTVLEYSQSEFNGRIRCEIDFSLRIVDAIHEFCVIVYPDGEESASHCAFMSVDSSLYDAAKNDHYTLIMHAGCEPRYGSWFEAHRACAGLLDGQRASSFTYEPLISIVVPLFQTKEEYLHDMISSVLKQSYVRWELILVNASPESETMRATLNAYVDERIKIIEISENQGIVKNTNRGIDQSKGDFIAFLDHDDMIEPDTLFEYVKAINDQPEADMLYCDEDVFKEQGVWMRPVFKPVFSPDLLSASNYITHFLMVRKACIEQQGRSPEYVSGAQDYDMTLRISEVARAIIHVPRVLYHGRIHEESSAGDNVDNKSYAVEAGRRALDDHFRRCGINAQVEEGVPSFTYKVVYAVPHPEPKVSIIIPNKDQLSVLTTCVESLIERVTYQNFEICIIENNSTTEEIFEYYREIQHRDERVKVVFWPDEFNYSKLMNFGADNTTGDYLLLLNNDTEVITPEFIEIMLGHFARPETGVVGAKLFFYDGLVQHAGVTIGPGAGAVGHTNQNFSRSTEGYMGRAVRPGNFSAVTGACQMVKRAIFNQVKGYTEDFAVGFNDIDFCLKVQQAGYVIAFTPYAQLYHREFASRGRDSFTLSKQIRFERERALMHLKWPEVFVSGDPYANPNLDKESVYFALGSDKW